jgi:uncharacterized membrane protein
MAVLPKKLPLGRRSSRVARRGKALVRILKRPRIRIDANAQRVPPERNLQQSSFARRDARRNDMERIEKTIEVDRPVRTVYNQWTQFEEFPRFMDGVKEVKQIDDTHVRWHAEVFGKDKQWDAEITEQVPDQKIGWKSISGDAPNAGTVRFEPIGPERTLVRLVMAYEPQGATENVGDALGLFSSRVEKSVKQFKKYIESRAVEDGAWRGEVRDSKPQSKRPH